MYFNVEEEYKKNKENCCSNSSLTFPQIVPKLIRLRRNIFLDRDSSPAKVEFLIGRKRLLIRSRPPDEILIRFFIQIENEVDVFLVVRRRPWKFHRCGYSFFSALRGEKKRSFVGLGKLNINNSSIRAKRGRGDKPTMLIILRVLSTD